MRKTFKTLFLIILLFIVFLFFGCKKEKNLFGMQEQSRVITSDRNAYVASAIMAARLVYVIPQIEGKNSANSTTIQNEESTLQLGDLSERIAIETQVLFKLFDPFMKYEAISLKENNLLNKINATYKDAHRNFTLAFKENISDNTFDGELIYLENKIDFGPFAINGKVTNNTLEVIY